MPGLLLLEENYRDSAAVVHHEGAKSKDHILYHWGFASLASCFRKILRARDLGARCNMYVVSLTAY
jgi:hypothetical protein